MRTSPLLQWKNHSTGCSSTNTSQMACVVLLPGQRCFSILHSFNFHFNISRLLKKSLSHRHRKMLEKVVDVDFVLKVLTSDSVSLFLCSCLFSNFSYFQIPCLGTDNPWIWWTLHLFAVWLQILFWVLLRCQSWQKAPEYSCTHLVSECCWWPFLSPEWWVYNKGRFTQNKNWDKMLSFSLMQYFLFSNI